ncbi:MAG: type II toxin-antitoxin system RelE/ParE family toxin [Nitrospinae bacterium]|nr:type II toxin-antitoxin system RelE/ParE family toxin [Nitrospinota bacterium]
MYKLTFKRQAIKALRKMSAREALHIRRELDELAESPDRRDSDVRPLRGRSGFRLRIGEMRIIFERDDDARIIDVLRIAPRGQAYR